MLSKETIFDNIEQYAAEDLAMFIKDGVFTYEELINEVGEYVTFHVRREIKNKLDEIKNKIEAGDPEAWELAQRIRTIEACNDYLRAYPEGKYRAEARQLKEEIEQEAQKVSEQTAEREAWFQVDKYSLCELQDYLRKYPNGLYREEAQQLIQELQKKEILGDDIDALLEKIRNIYHYKKLDDKTLDPVQQDTNVYYCIRQFIDNNASNKREFLRALSHNHNLFRPRVAKLLLEDNYLAMYDLESLGIEKAFIKKLYTDPSQPKFPTPSRLTEINKQSTEVYFWGIPQSGKSCVLGAILSVAASGLVAKVMEPDTESQGYGYMTQLINLFQDGEICTLMEGTGIESFYEMGFDLKDDKNCIHPITCIDMAGELMRCMYLYDAGRELEEDKMVMLETMHKVLNGNLSTNRKMHFFIIEYGAEDRLYEGLPQNVYINGVVSYIKKTKLFKENTDAIYILITKADKAKNATPSTFRNYILDKYRGFYNRIEDICKENEINGGKVELMAFSLGEVCFQHYCKFDARPAANVVRLLMERSASGHTGIRRILELIFNG